MSSRQTSSFWSMSHALKYMWYGVMICAAEERVSAVSVVRLHQTMTSDDSGHWAWGGRGGGEPRERIPLS